MIFKFLILLQFLSVLHLGSTPDNNQIKAWIEIEGELNALSIKAKIENASQENMFLNYELEMHSRTRVKDKKTLQKGKFLALKQSITALTESRMNVKSTQELCVLFKIFHEDKVVAIDSVVFHASK